MERKQETVIFLDIDGVLQHDAYRRFCLRKDWNYNWRLDPNCLLLLKEIQEKHPEVKVVISSSWRGNKTKLEFENLFKQSGYEIQMHEHWKTKNYVHPTYQDYFKYMKYLETFTEPKYRPKDTSLYLKDFEKMEKEQQLHFRGWEILDWLVNQPDDVDTRFFILDDSDDMLFLTSELIYILNGEINGGFTVNYQEKILKYLEKDFEKGNQYVYSRFYFFKDRYNHPEKY